MATLNITLELEDEEAAKEALDAIRYDWPSYVVSSSILSGRASEDEPWS